jgi:hypothetical protein
MTDLPWYTDEERNYVSNVATMKAINELNHPKLPHIFEWQEPEQPPEKEEVVYFKRQVLDKYVGHPYVSFGPDQDENGFCERLRFINMKDKRVDSSIRFVDDGEKYVKVRSGELKEVPPRQIDHWESHRVK